VNGKVGKTLFWAWFAVFLAGALAQLLGLDGLAAITDVKQIFLR
jgi:hypothetical protein